MRSPKAMARHGFGGPAKTIVCELCDNSHWVLKTGPHAKQRARSFFHSIGWKVSNMHKQKTTVCPRCQKEGKDGKIY